MQQKQQLNFSFLLCPKKNKVFQLCISQQCQKCALICLKQDCQCHQKIHKQCQYCRANTILDKIKSKKKKIPSQIDKAFQAIDLIYQEAIQELSKDRERASQKCSMYGLKFHQSKFLNLINQGHLQEITGKLVNQVRKDLCSVDDDFSFLNQDLVQKFWKHKKQDFQKVRQHISSLTSGQKFSLLQSKITKDQFQLKQFFTKPVFQFKLLYRASQHRFSVSQFHNRCDYKKDTLVLILTEDQKIIGGYTPLVWNTHNSYYPDHKGQTFIFSLSLKQKYQLKNRQNAIRCGTIYGPSFGSGHDIYIADEANTNNKSYAYFPSSFNTPENNYLNNQHAHSQFTGVNQGYNFRVKEWEVFQIEWQNQDNNKRQE